MYGPPITAKVRLFIGAGLGYYIAKFDRFYRREPGDGYWIDTEMTGKSGGIGFEGEIGFEYSITKKVSILIEGCGRYAYISGLEGTQDRIDSNNWSDSLEAPYFYLEQYRAPFGWFPAVTLSKATPTGPDSRYAREAKLNFSGFTVRIGVKIHLF
jgi:hypothetical protein